MATCRSPKRQLPGTVGVTYMVHAATSVIGVDQHVTGAVAFNSSSAPAPRADGHRPHRTTRSRPGAHSVGCRHVRLRPACWLSPQRLLTTPLGPPRFLAVPGVCYSALRRLPRRDLHQFGLGPCHEAPTHGTLARAAAPRVGGQRVETARNKVGKPPRVRWAGFAGAMSGERYSEPRHADSAVGRSRQRCHAGVSECGDVAPHRRHRAAERVAQQHGTTAG